MQLEKLALYCAKHVKVNETQMLKYCKKHKTKRRWRKKYNIDGANRQYEMTQKHNIKQIIQSQVIYKKAIYKKKAGKTCQQ